MIENGCRYTTIDCYHMSSNIKPGLCITVGIFEEVNNMKEKRSWTDNQGIVQSEYTLEAGDIVTIISKSIRTNTNGQYPNYFVSVTDEQGYNCTVKLSPKQADTLSKLQELVGTKIECYSYDTQYRTGCVGIKVLNGTNKVPNSTRPAAKMQVPRPTDNTIAIQKLTNFCIDNADDFLKYEPDVSAAFLTWGSSPAIVEEIGAQLSGKELIAVYLDARDRILNER